MAKHLPACLEELAKELPLTMAKSEACAVMQLSVRSFERAVKKGEIRALKSHPGQNGKVIVTRAEVLRWMAERVGAA